MFTIKTPGFPVLKHYLPMLVKQQLVVIFCCMLYAIVIYTVVHI